MFLFGTRSCTASRLSTPADYFAMTSVDVPAGASSAVLKPSDPLSNDAVSVQGPNFDNPLDLQQFISSYERIGFQANSLGKAIHIVNKMVCTPQYINVLFRTHPPNRSNGVSPTNPGRMLNRMSSKIPKSEPGQNATCFSVTRPI